MFLVIVFTSFVTLIVFLVTSTYIITWLSEVADSSLEQEDAFSQVQQERTAPASASTEARCTGSPSIKHTSCRMKQRQETYAHQRTPSEPQLSKQIVGDLDARDMQLGGSAMHWCKSRRTLNSLLVLGYSLDESNQVGDKPIHIATSRRRLSVLIGLLCNGANVESTNAKGETALIVAARNSDVFATQLLLVFDANVDAVDSRGLSARHYVAESSSKNSQKPRHASHLILAMLHEVGATRCKKHDLPNEQPQNIEKPNDASSTDQSSALVASKAEAANSTREIKPRVSQRACYDGCAPDKTYNGSHLSRWPDYSKESLYKRCLFTDIIEKLVLEKEARKAERERAEVGASKHTKSATSGTTKKTSSAESSNSQATISSFNPQKKRKSRILCLDGGGLRGVIVCQIMIEIEKYLKSHFIDYFDWVGGTSVGAFTAALMCTGTSLQELRRLCFLFKDEVFSGTRPYSSKALEKVLQTTLGATTKMSDIKNHKLALPTVLADRDPCQLKIFRNYKSPTQLLTDFGYPPDVFDYPRGYSSSQVASKSVPDLQTQLPTNVAITNPANADLRYVKISGFNPASPQRIDEINSETETTSRTCEQRSASLVDENSKSSENNSTNLATLIRRKDSALVTGHSSTLDDIADSMLDETDLDPLLWKAVRASAAAPFFFKPYGSFLDGGIISNNPTIDILTEFFANARVAEFINKRNLGIEQIYRGAKANAQWPTATTTPQQNTVINANVIKSVSINDGNLTSMIDSSEDRTPKTSDMDFIEQFKQAVKERAENKVKSPAPGGVDSLLMSDVTPLGTSNGQLELVLSLGTGRGKVSLKQKIVDFAQVASGFARMFAPVEFVRSIRAARDLFRKLMHQTAQTEDYILDRAQAWCASLNSAYFRVNPPLTSVFQIDDKRDEQLVNALWQTKLYMRAMHEQLLELARLLDDED